MSILGLSRQRYVLRMGQHAVDGGGDDHRVVFRGREARVVGSTKLSKRYNNSTKLSK